MKRVYFRSSYYNEILHELRGISMEIRDELDLCATEFGDFEEDEFLEFELWKTASDAMEEWREDNTPFIWIMMCWRSTRTRGWGLCDLTE